MLRKQRLALAPILLVFFGYGGVTENFGFGKALDESANWIVKVPPVMIIRRPAESLKRVKKSSVNQSQILSRTVLLLASALPLIGSSTMPRSKPLPVIWPPTVVL